MSSLGEVRVGFGSFGWKNILALEVAVHHDNGGSVPVNVADNDGHGGQPRQLTGVFAAVACDQLVAAVLPWPCQRGDEDAVLLDAFGGFLHGRILRKRTIITRLESHPTM